jgi:hypothetical protein
VATIVAFGGAFETFSIRPWGPFVAGTLMLVWVALAVASGYRQWRLDGVANPAATTKMGPLERVLRAATLVVATGLYLYGMLLAHQSKPGAVVRGYEEAAFAVLIVGNLSVLVFNWLYPRVAGARTDKVTPN